LKGQYVSEQAHHAPPDRLLILLHSAYPFSDLVKQEFVEFSRLVLDSSYFWQFLAHEHLVQGQTTTANLSSC
jgi:hypothetical protein